MSVPSNTHFSAQEAPQTVRFYVPLLHEQNKMGTEQQSGAAQKAVAM
jgi:hypothetical protein